MIECVSYYPPSSVTEDRLLFGIAECGHHVHKGMLMIGIPICNLHHFGHGNDYLLEVQG